MGWGAHVLDECETPHGKHKRHRPDEGAASPPLYCAHVGPDLRIGLRLSWDGAVDLNQYVTAGLGAPSQRPPVSKEEKPSQAPLLAPSFDIASVDERGTLVAAGRSEAGWTIQLKSKSRILGETKADDNNQWVLTPEASLPPGEHTLSLLAIDPTGQRSLAAEQESRIIVAPRRVAAQTPQTPVPALQASGRAAASPALPSHHMLAKAQEKRDARPQSSNQATPCGPSPITVTVTERSIQKSFNRTAR